jgi:hypothetical protein
MWLSALLGAGLLCSAVSPAGIGPVSFCVMYTCDEEAVLTIYTVPIGEMLFVISEVGGLAAVLQQPGHEEIDTNLVMPTLTGGGWRGKRWTC